MSRASCWPGWRSRLLIAAPSGDCTHRHRRTAPAPSNRTIDCLTGDMSIEELRQQASESFAEEEANLAASSSVNPGAVPWDDALSNLYRGCTAALIACLLSTFACWQQASSPVLIPKGLPSDKSFGPAAPGFSACSRKSGFTPSDGGNGSRVGG
jgi:hypothetical protein